MYEKMRILCAGLTLLAITLTVAVVVLVQSARKRSAFSDSRTLRNIRERCSVIPLAINLFTWVVFLLGLLFLSLESVVGGLLLLLALVLGGLSAFGGPAVSLLGLVFSVVSIRKQSSRRSGISCAIVAVLSLLMSLCFLYWYLSELL